MSKQEFIERMRELVKFVGASYVQGHLVSALNLYEMDDPAETQQPAKDRIALQNGEFDALTKLGKHWKQLQDVAVVDNDYPEVRHRYEGALKDFIRAMEENGRFK